MPIYNTEQEVFDLVAKHLLTQGRPAMVDGRCVYRAPDGAMCALGCLIPDELYEQEMEYKNSYSILMDRPEVWRALFSDRVSYEFIEALQRIHDWRDPGTWRHLLAELGRTHTLNIDVLQ